VCEDISKVSKIQGPSLFVQLLLDHCIEEILQVSVLEQKDLTLVIFIWLYKIKAFDVQELCSYSLRPMLRFSKY
jgi:hypothetical protein